MRAATYIPWKPRSIWGKLIVADFHSPTDAAAAAEKFNREVRQKEVPSEIKTVPLPEEV